MKLLTKTVCPYCQKEMELLSTSSWDYSAELGCKECNIIVTIEPIEYD
jgi:uncharacterized protein YbaR (Trm112 family)